MSRSHEDHDSNRLEREEVSLETQEVRLLKEIVILLRRLIFLVEEVEVEVQPTFLPSISATFTPES
jgi:hypothetical protein